MSDDRKFIPRRNAPGYRDIREECDAARPLVEPHFSVDEGVVRAVHPSNAMTIGSMRMEGGDTYMSTISMSHAFGPTTLLFLPTAAELRALGQEMLDTAERMETEARSMLDAALATRKGGA